MLNGRYNGEVRAYLLALQDGNKPERPDIPKYWQLPVEQAESVYLRSEGDGEAVKRLLSTLCKINTDLAELLATERPPLALARVQDETPSPDVMGGSELQEALLAKDMARVEEHISEIAAFDDIKLAKFKMALHNVFGSAFHLRYFEELLRAEKRRLEVISRRKVPDFISLHELMQMTFERKSWIVPSILPPGLIALAGKQKIGKSWLDYNLSIAVATGGMAFGSIPCEPGDVLYMALEDNRERLQDRFTQLLEPGQLIPQRITLVTEFPRMDAEGVAVLEQWIQAQPNPRLIIIDPWVKVKPKVKTRQGETGYDADYEALEGIKRLADVYKVCILVQFHLRKAGGEDPFDELNGTSGITACADGFLSLKRARGESDAVLWGTGRDYRTDVDLALKFSNGYWNILGDAKAYNLTKESKEIIELLNASDRPLYPKEIARALQIPDGTVRVRLLAMKKRDEIKDTGKGYVSLIDDSAEIPNTPNGPNDANTPNGEVKTLLSASETVSVRGSDEKVLTLVRLDVEPDDVGAVRTVRGVRGSDKISTELQKEAQQLLSEVQIVFKERAGIPQFWRDDISPMRKIEQPDWIAKATEAIASGDPERIQLAITAMKWTTKKLYPGREKEELAQTPLQG